MPAKKNTKVAQDKSEIVEAIPMACASEPAAVELIESLIWGDDRACPRCGDMDVYQVKDRKTGERNKDYRWRCRGCKKFYTVRTGTIMEQTRIPLKHWCYAFWRACTSKKGVSALEIKRHTGLSYKSALFLMHRIRWAMSGSGPENGKLNGTVEADETHVGGKPRHRKAYKPGMFRDAESNYSTRRDRHTPVFGAVERGGRVATKVIPDVTSATLRQAVNEMIDTRARLMTDAHNGYKSVGKEYASHETVNHGRYEYVRGDVTTNTIESFWAILKRGVYGIWHNVSRKHLHRYVACSEFRYNHRALEDGERTVAAIRAGRGKRLMYRDQVGA